MTDTESKLLDDLLECLDRLFDGHAKAIDVRDMLLAASNTLSGTKHCDILRNTSAKLDCLIALRSAPRLESEQALAITDDLRNYLAALQ